MTVSINGMAEAFRAQLDAPGPIELPGCHDSLSAMIIEEVGFRSVFLSGYGVAASLMGNPDIGLTTMSETALIARYGASRDNMKRVCNEVPGNKQVNLIWGGVTPSMTVGQLHAMGFKIIQYSTPTLYVMSNALRHTMSRLREAHQLDAISDWSDKFHEFQ